MIELFIERQVRDAPFIFFKKESYKNTETSIYGIIILGVCFGIEIKNKSNSRVE